MSVTNGIRLDELKDTITQLNITIQNQKLLIQSLQKTIEGFQENESRKDQMISVLAAGQSA